MFNIVQLWAYKVKIVNGTQNLPTGKTGRVNLRKVVSLVEIAVTMIKACLNWFLVLSLTTVKYLEKLLHDEPFLLFYLTGDWIPGESETESRDLPLLKHLSIDEVKHSLNILFKYWLNRSFSTEKKRFVNWAPTWCCRLHIDMFYSC